MVYGQYMIDAQVLTVGIFPIQQNTRSISFHLPNPYKQGVDKWVLRAFLCEKYIME